MPFDCKVSVVVLGEIGVGKSSLLLRFAKNIFKENLTSTIIDCYHSDLHVQGKHVRLELWDTAGQERFKSVVQNYFRKADGVLLVYDVTDVTSLHKLTSWFLELKAANETAVSIIVGNKIDDPNRNAVSVNLAKRFGQEENLEFFESSAKTGENVTKIFESLTTKILEAKNIIYPAVIIPNEEDPEPPKKNESYDPPTNIQLHKTTIPKKKKKGCCS